MTTETNESFIKRTSGRTSVSLSEFDEALRRLAEAEEQLRENERLREALCELVALKEFTATHTTKYTPRQFDSVESQEEYKRRKPAAWSAAREALSPTINSGEIDKSVSTPPAVPDGYVMVLREPDDTMISAGKAAGPGPGWMGAGGVYRDDIKKIWRAMIEAGERGD